MKLRFSWLFTIVWLWPTLLMAKPSELKVAVASNFVFALQQLKGDFELQHQCTVVLSSGSTGLLAAQVQRRAPFDLFFAADQKRLAQLYAQGIVSEPVTYALGSLVLWQPLATNLNWQKWLHQPPTDLVIAEPKLAPYGAAAQQVLVKNRIQIDKKVIAHNVNQAFQYVDTGNVSAALMAKSSLVLASQRFGHDKYQHYVEIPEQEYAPIKQDVAVVLNRPNVELAQAFVDYITAPNQQRKLAALGYRLRGQNNG